MRKGNVTERVEKRRERVAELVLVDGIEDTEQIADALIGDGTIKTTSRDSAIRLVRSDVALIRDVSDSRKYVERRLYAMRLFRRIANDESEISFDVITPKGETVAVSKPKWPASVRARCLHYFSEEAEAVARIAFVDVTGRRKQPPGAGKGARYTGTVPIDLSELHEEERKAIAEAMKKFPGGEGEGGEDGGAAN